MIKKIINSLKKNKSAIDLNNETDDGENLYKLMQLLNSKKVYDVSDFSVDEIESILFNLNDDESLCFFDYFHPQWSDPGAYVTIERFSENYIYMLGNHGWSSSWHLSDIDRLCRYINKNKGYQKDAFYVRKKSNAQNRNYEIQIEKLWKEKLTLVYQNNNNDGIYEVNGYHIVNLAKREKAIIIEERFEENIKRKEYYDILDYYNKNFELFPDREVILTL